MRADNRTPLAACLLVNLAILMINRNLSVSLRIALLLVGALCVRPASPPGRLFTTTAIACLLTAIHAASNFFLNDLLFHVGLVFNRDFAHESELEDGRAGRPHTSMDASLEHGLPILFELAQATIRTSQSKCHSNVTILQVQGYLGGMGAELHRHAAVLAVAMVHEHALFVWGDQACQTYSAHCRELYLPEHACTDDEIHAMRHTVNVTDWPAPVVPAQLATHLPESFTPAQTMYWWRSQAIAYLMRFNAHTNREIQNLRVQLHGNLSFRGAINVNIRGGDKRNEARPTPPERMVEHANDLITSNPLAFSRTLFLTSDSLPAILTAKMHAEHMRLHVVYSKVPRMRYGHNQGDVKAFWNYNVTIAVLMELTLAAECDGWIGSRSSNWNRLIDLLRCTHARKCPHIFVETGDTPEGHYDSNPSYWL